jgi:nitrogen fixation/metabolism regulation signal transduction histidine kinase
MFIEGLFYVIYWVIFIILIVLSIRLLNISKDEGLSIVFGVLVFLLLLLAMNPELKPVKPIKELITTVVEFNLLFFIAGGIILGGIVFAAVKYLKDSKTAAKLGSSVLVFVALTFGVSLIWMTSIAGFMGNALLGLLFSSLIVWLFFRKT